MLKSSDGSKSLPPKLSLLREKGSVTGRNGLSRSCRFDSSDSG